MVERAKNFLSQLAEMSETEVARYYLGTGSTREAYVFEKDFVIKIPRFIVRFSGSVTTDPHLRLGIIQKGVRQTNTEIMVYNKCEDRVKYLLNPIVAHGRFLNVPFVVMPKIKIASDIVPFDVEDLDMFLEWTNTCVPWSFGKDIKKLSKRFGLDLLDLSYNMDNFGIDTKNQLMITDYGTKE